MGAESNGRVRVAATLVVVTTVIGLLVAGIVVPVFAGAGLGVKKAAESFQSLPSELDLDVLPVRSRILAADGSTMATFYYQNRVAVPITAVAPVMQQAIVAIEDNRFYEHRGVDPRGLVRAVVTNSQAGGVVQGGSTITQQWVKNVLLNTASDAAEAKAAVSRDVGRKIREMRYALAAEEKYTKAQILEGYLNIAYFGKGAYGIEAASRTYFGIPASALNLAQASLLAGLVRNPYGYDPVRHPERATERRTVVLQRMRELGYITPEAETATRKVPLNLKYTPQPNGCVTSPAPYFCDYVVRRLQNDSTLGSERGQRTAALLRGGLTIHTTFDPRVQRQTQAGLDESIERTNRVGAGVAVVEPGTGAVRALAQNRNYGRDTAAKETTLNYATDRAHGGSSGFEAGSTFKVFVLAEAIRQGIPPSLTLTSPPQYTSPIFRDCSKGCGPYTVSNPSRAEDGTWNMWEATPRSVNTYYMQLQERTSQPKAVEFADAVGVHQGNGADFPKGRDFGSFVLGPYSVAPLDMAAAYATFAADGKYCEPMVVSRIQDRYGKDLPGLGPKCKEVMTADQARTVAAILQGVTKQPGTGWRIPTIFGRPVAGKTGTAQNSGGAWFVGFTPQYATAVGMGDPRGGQARPLRGHRDPVTHKWVTLRIKGQVYPYIDGGKVPAPTFARIMRNIHDGLPVRGFAPPGS